MPKIYSESYKKVILDDLDKCGSIPKISKKYHLNYSIIYRWSKDRLLQNKEVLSRNKVDIPQNISFFDSSEGKDTKILNNSTEELKKENSLLRNIIVNKEMEIVKLKQILSNNNITL